MLSSLSCVSCGGPMLPWLYMPIDPMRHEETRFSSALKCSACGLGSISPMPQPDEIAAHYDLPEYYTHGGKAVAPKPSIAERVLSKLAHLADRSEPFKPEIVAQSLKPSGRICDLGCGHADYLVAFKELGFEVIGVDPDPSARHEACRRGVMVLEGTTENLPDLGGNFDLVILSHSLEHCIDPAKALSNAASILKPGGRCYVEVPNCASEAFRTFTICSMLYDAPRHLHFFTPASLTLLAERLGLTVSRRSFVYYERDFSPGWREYEASIADKGYGKRHTFAAGVGLFLRSFWRSGERKYDSFGLTLASDEADRPDCVDPVRRG